MSAECLRCNATMSTRDGDDPTEFCDHCAHDLLAALCSRLEDREGLAGVIYEATWSASWDTCPDPDPFRLLADRIREYLLKGEK